MEHQSREIILLKAMPKISRGGLPRPPSVQLGLRGFLMQKTPSLLQNYLILHQIPSSYPLALNYSTITLSWLMKR